MAVNCTCSIQIPIQRYGSFLRYPMSKRSYVPLKKASVSRRITASMKNKVYEDQSQGIICYQDEFGEIICEGYDEGPCFQRIPEPTNRPREPQITNILLRQTWLQIVKGENSNDAVDGRLQKDFNSNGFNSFC